MKQLSELQISEIANTRKVINNLERDGIAKSVLELYIDSIREQR